MLHELAEKNAKAFYQNRDTAVSNQMGTVGIPAAELSLYLVLVLTVLVKQIAGQEKQTV